MLKIENIYYYDDDKIKHCLELSADAVNITVNGQSLDSVINSILSRLSLLEGGQQPSAGKLGENALGDFILS